MHREMLVSGLAMSVEVFSHLKRSEEGSFKLQSIIQGGNKTISYDIENRFVIFANCSN